MRHDRTAFILWLAFSASISTAHAQGNLNGAFGVTPVLSQHCTYTSREQTERLLDRLVALNLFAWWNKNCDANRLTGADSKKIKSMAAFYDGAVSDCYSKKDAGKIFLAIRQPKKGLACNHPVVEQTVTDVRHWLQASDE